MKKTRTRTLLGFVLHADLEPGPILQDLTVITQVDIESVDFRHPQMSDGLGGFHNRILRCRFPTLGATADDFDHLIRAHRLLRGEWLGAKQHAGSWRGFMKHHTMGNTNSHTLWFSLLMALIQGWP